MTQERDDAYYEEWTKRQVDYNWRAGNLLREVDLDGSVSYRMMRPWGYGTPPDWVIETRDAV